MRFDILTIFPALFEPFLVTSLIGQARQAGLLKVRVHDIRQAATDKHKTVDDTPYGGGPGMVMRIEPIDRALAAIDRPLPRSPSSGGTLTPAEKTSRVVVLAARGEQFTQAKAQEYARLDQLILICSRYEGIDQRVADYLADEELTIGPYVLAGGEAAAMVVVEAVARLVPGVIGNPESLEEESFASTTYNLRPTPSIEYPQYTKPAEYKGWKVPEVLLSGNHGAIRRWRAAQRRRSS